MSLADDLKNLTTKRRLCPCAQFLTEQGVDVDEFAEFARLIETRMIQYKDLMPKLWDNGYQFKRDTVARHLKGECTCDPR